MLIRTLRGRHDIRNFWSLLVLVMLAAWVWMVVDAFLTRWERRTSRILAVAGGMMLAPFLPASNLLFVVGFAVAERVLYMPSIGAVIFIAWLLQQFRHRVIRYLAHQINKNQFTSFKLSIVKAITL